MLFAEGDRNCDFFAILDGTVAVADARGTADERIRSAHGRGRLLGFSAAFLQYLAMVSGDSSARGRAARDLARMVIADLREDRASPSTGIGVPPGFQAIQSTPLAGQDGRSRACCRPTARVRAACR
jgi:hypothetical protein